eukprot:1933296-Prymnesium_polylepis.1
MKSKQLPRKDPARSRRVAELDAACCVVDSAGYVIHYAGLLSEPSALPAASPAAVPPLRAPPPWLP